MEQDTPNSERKEQAKAQSITDRWIRRLELRIGGLQTQLTALQQAYDDKSKPPSDTPCMSVLDEINQERARQVGKGFDESHDDHHTDGQLVAAAICYAGGDNTMWPWTNYRFDPLKTSRRVQLIRAAALIVAEVERVDRRQLEDSIEADASPAHEVSGASEVDPDDEPKLESEFTPKRVPVRVCTVTVHKDDSDGKRGTYELWDVFLDAGKYGPVVQFGKAHAGIRYYIDDLLKQGPRHGGDNRAFIHGGGKLWVNREEFYEAARKAKAEFLSQTLGGMA